MFKKNENRGKHAGAEIKNNKKNSNKAVLEYRLGMYYDAIWNKLDVLAY